MTTIHVLKRSGRRFYTLWYTDELTGKKRTKSAETDNYRLAERAAENWRNELETRGEVGSNISWDAFRERFRKEHAATLATSSWTGYRAAFNSFEEFAGHPRSIRLINAGLLSKYAAWVIKEVDSIETAKNRLRHIRRALSWAQSIGLLNFVPNINMPRGKKSKMKGRPVSRKEFEIYKNTVVDYYSRNLKFLANGSKVKPADYGDFMEGLYLSGLRISEAVALSWDSGDVMLDMDGGEYPRIIFRVEGHKSRTDEIVPIPPDFADYINAMKTLRTGPVFKILNENAKNFAKRLQDIGRLTGIKVNEKGKHVGPHDLRRSCITRWAPKVPPTVLKQMFRHKNIQTTMEYYVSQEADVMGAIIHGSVTKSDTQKQPNGKKLNKRPAKTPRKKR
jgi:integrase